MQCVLKIGFCTSKKGVIMGDGWVSALDAVHMAAALAGYIEQPWLVLA